MSQQMSLNLHPSLRMTNYSRSSSSTTNTCLCIQRQALDTGTSQEKSFKKGMEIIK